MTTLRALREARRSRHFQQQYGLTCAQYATMLTMQEGKCAICGRKPKRGGRRLSVDHDHATGRVRGLVDHTCNRFRIARNTVESARRVLAYLDSDFDGRTLP